MHRIDTSGATSTNQFTDGNPATGQEGTVVDAAWLNDFQENIVAVVEAAGIVLIKGDYTQLHAAIVALATGAAGTGGGSVPTSREVEGGGLVQGGGALTSDLTLSVPEASPADMLALSDHSKVVTAGGMGDMLSFTKAIPGKITLFGFTIMWGTASANANTFTNVNLPFGGFPNACAFATFEGGSADPSAQDNNPFVASKTLTTLSVFNSRDGAVNGMWFAFGW